MNKTSIIIRNPTSRVYTDAVDVATIRLGDGLTRIGVCKAQGDAHGLLFMENPSNESLPEYDSIEGIQVTSSMNAYFQIITREPQALQNMIDALQEAKIALIKNLNSHR